MQYTQTETSPRSTSLENIIEPWQLHVCSFMLARRSASYYSSSPRLSTPWRNAPHRRRLTILAIETSCDDVRLSILSAVVYSS